MNKEKRLVIIGAGGHGKVAADIARKQGYKVICFLDDTAIAGVEGKVSEFGRFLDNADFFVAIGNSAVREKITNELQSKGARIVCLIHPNAVVAENVRIGKGTIIMAGAVVNTDTEISDGVIINTCASVDHDCKIARYVHIAVGAHVCGTVEIGEHTWVGAGAILINNISICAECMIGAGAAIIGSIDTKGTYVGVPGRKIK